MSEIFSQYEKEYTDLVTSIKAKIEASDVNIGQLTRELEELEEILGTMEIETNTLTINVKSTLTPKIKMYKEQVKGFKKQFTALKSSAASERDQLLKPSDKDRSRLLDGTARLEQGSKRLEEARRVALDTEQIGISTLEDLNRQREQLERTSNTLNTADSWIAKSQGVLKGMQRRLQTNKMLQIALIVVLVIIILIVVFFRIFS